MYRTRDSGKKTTNYGIIATFAFLALLYIMAKQIYIEQIIKVVPGVVDIPLSETEGEEIQLDPNLAPGLNELEEEESAPVTGIGEEIEIISLPPEVVASENEPEEDENFGDPTVPEEFLKEPIDVGPIDVPLPQPTGQDNQPYDRPGEGVDDKTGIGPGNGEEIVEGNERGLNLGNNVKGGGGNGGEPGGLFGDFPTDLIVFDKLADWMREHPYRFSPQLKESMKHKKGDLTSRVTNFQSSKGLFTLYLLHRPNTRNLAIGFAQVSENSFDILSDASWDGIPEKYLKAISVTFDSNPDKDIVDVSLKSKKAVDGQSLLTVLQEWWVKTLN